MAAAEVPQGQKRKRGQVDSDSQHANANAKAPKPVYKNIELAKQAKPIYKNIELAKQSRPVYKNLELAKKQKKSKKSAKLAAAASKQGENAPKATLPEKNSQPQPSTLARKPGKQTTLQTLRENLPIYPHADSIRSALTNTNILLLAGETGSGKSTQVPQFLLTSPWCDHRVAVTQPRRMAAISLARRVADEMGTALGKSSPTAKVGYSVRFDDNVGKGNKIKFLTEGMLLQEMLRDPGLLEYSCVVVDEVHERSVNVDLILGFLRDLLVGKGEGARKRKGRPLKVVVMSATADTEKLKGFFEEGYRITKGDTATTNGTGTSEEKSKKSELSLLNDERQQPGQDNARMDGSDAGRVSTCFVEGRQYPVQTIYLHEAVQDFSEAALKCIFQVHCKEPMPGDILVFLTGQDTVQSLQKLVEEYAATLTEDFPKLLVLPLFAALPQAAQQRIFEPAPRNTRKLILATNIAETSITVGGVRFVIDCGKAKIKQYRNRLGLDSLLVKPISKSSAIQRKGRAGREAAGKCWRLYTEKDFDALEKDSPPEILRCDLSAAVLTMKARGVDDVMSFPLLTQPPREAMERALLQLLQLGALDDDGRVNDTGRRIARLPLTPSLGRVIIAAADPDMDCLLQVIDIVACFSVENIFLNAETEEMKEEAQQSRNLLYRRQGDHLTLLAAVQAYAAESSDRKMWAQRHLISHRAMQSVMDVRKQLRAQAQQAKLVSSDALAATDERTSTSEETANNILRCFLRGFMSNVARLMPDGSYKTIVGNQNVAIHPSSILFGRKVEAILYNEFVYTNRTYARGVSAIQLNWLDKIWGDA
ncbi:Salivary acidic proline-rich phosphoprotein 1/2 [Zalaria obscura]|uniref:Salivary acidic proline-rich phosphoprotein 1/2 n=1 Tax=Zalaria obscura TaxID=2024903 RepID=A0ACC3SPI3_9PEZI